MPNPKRRGRRMIVKDSYGKTHVIKEKRYFLYSSLSEVEDRNDLAFWNSVTQTAAVKAINENKAMNIPVTVLENDWIVRKSSDGTVERIKKIEKRASINRFNSLSKGSILHVKSN